MSKQRIRIPARRQFQGLLETEKRWGIAVAHRRAGKTVACVQKLYMGALKCKRPKPRFAYIAPLYTQAKDVAWEYVRQYAVKLGATPHETELRVDLPSGARIRLYGADNPNRLRGLYWDGVVLDEYADMRPSVWGEVIRPLLADRQGWATFIGTPKGHNAFYDVWQEAQKDTTWFGVMLKASQTGLLAENELADARKGMSQDQYMQEFECSFEAAIHGAYFAEAMRKLRAEHRIGRVPLDPSRPVHTCWDIGKDDPTAIWFFQAHGQMIHLIHYFEDSGEGTDYYVRKIKEIGDQRGFLYGRHYGPHDLDNSHWVLPGAEASVDVARRLGLSFIVVPRIPNKQQAIDAARNWLSMCWIDEEHCKDGIEALDHYRKEWDDKRETWRSKPEHDWASHGADALMTGACGFTPDFVPPPSDRYAKPQTRRSAWAA